MHKPESISASEAAQSDARTTWASYGHGTDAESEDFIVGSRTGLLRLKEHIERAIDQGESLIPEMGIEFNGVRRLDIDGDISEKSRSSSLAGWGCLLIAVSILFLAFVGLKSFISK